LAGRREKGQALCIKVESELASWNLLARCMSNDGVIALAIDDAGPTLSALANDLLLACYGPRFTVSIHTLLETAKGEQKEGFDIVVHDGTTGDAKSAGLMSGGERTYHVGEDDIASRIEHVDSQHEFGHRWHRPFDAWLGIAGAPQRSRRPPGMGVAVEVRRGDRGLSVDLSGMQDLGGDMGHDVHGGLKQRDRHGVRGLGPGAAQPLAIAGGLAMAATWEGLDLQAIVQVGAKAIEVGEQVQMPLHRRRRSRRAPDHGKLRQPALKLQKCRCIQNGKANKALLVHQRTRCRSEKK